MTNLAAATKRRIALRSFLQGREFYTALEAMDFAERHHTGYRKDKITPEFDHQISIALYLRTLLPSLMYPEATLATSFLHDVREDKGVSHDEIDSRFGAQIARSVACMTKEFRGIKKDIRLVFDEIANDACASMAKPSDRVHNFQTMVGVFTISKQVEYISECKDYILPAVKLARRQFPRQEPAYENVKHVLVSQIELVEAMHTAIK